MTTLRSIGLGTYSCVYDGGEGTAVKTSIYGDYTGMMKERLMISMCEHPNVIKLLPPKYTDDIDKIYMPAYECDLRVHLDRDALTLTDIWTLTYDLLSAVDHIHMRGIIHGDIKPENLLIARPPGRVEVPRLVLCDFGLSMFADDEYHESNIQTPLYRAPEVNISTERSKHSFAVDMWSIGCVLYEMITRRALIDYRKGVEDTTVYACEIFGLHAWKRRKDRINSLSSLNILTVVARLRTKILTHIPGRAYNELSAMGIISFMARCLQPRKCRRPSASQALYDIYSVKVEDVYRPHAQMIGSIQFLDGMIDVDDVKGRVHCIELAKRIHVGYLQACATYTRDIVLRYACLFIALTLFSGTGRMLLAIENRVSRDVIIRIVKVIMIKMHGRIA
jgi:serine/threonine protein kinase